MAKTPEEALALHVRAIGDNRVVRMADTIHLPFQHHSTDGKVVFQYDTPDDVPEYMEVWNPGWAGSSCELLESSVILASDVKAAYRVLARRFNADGTPMQDFEAIYTLLIKDGDWRVISRNPINIFPL